jgi:hypothetical protein
LIKLQDGEAQKLFTRCPHAQCGHVFETVNEVNQHMIFRHVSEPAILKETTASQYSPIGSTSTGCNPIAELTDRNLCTNCGIALANKPPDSKASPSGFSDISDDADAPMLIKEEVGVGDLFF